MLANRMILKTGKETTLLKSGLFAVACSLVLATGCTKSTDGLESADQKKNAQVAENSEANSNDQAIDAVKDESGAKIIRKKSTLSSKGTNIPILVNGEPITNYDINRRRAFVRLRRMKGNHRQIATQELIDERLKHQEAVAKKTLVSETVANQAYANFAKRNKLTPSQMSQVLSQAGVTSKHFKEFLRNQISWQRTVGARFQSKSREVSQNDALFSIRKSGEAKPETQEYVLQQVIFVVPQSQRKKRLRQRVAEAKTFRQQFTNCNDTLGQVKNLRDVALKNLGRVMEPELPANWKKEVTTTEVGKTTRVQETEKGAEFLAVCSMRNVSDDRAAQLVTQSKEFSSLGTQGNAESEKYLKELKSKATIVYR